MILVIDNYDSFVYNLSRYIEELGETVHVVRNNAITLPEIKSMAPKAIILSPGPCGPNEAGICLPLVQHFKAVLPIFGVCLGHQVIAQALGGTVRRATNPMHGMPAATEHRAVGCFAGMPSPMQVGRYHSLIVDDASLPDTLEVTARCQSHGEIMGLRHRHLPVEGVQFHPESVMTRWGKKMIQNFLSQHVHSAT